MSRIRQLAAHILHDLAESDARVTVGAETVIAPFESETER
jgi:hypothetical protein